MKKYLQAMFFQQLKAYFLVALLLGFFIQNA